MFFPIRCFTCGSVIGNRYDEYAKQVKEGKNPAKVLESMGIARYCCRRMFLGHVEVIDKIVKYRKV